MTDAAAGAHRLSSDDGRRRLRRQLRLIDRIWITQAGSGGAGVLAAALVSAAGHSVPLQLAAGLAVAAAAALASAAWLERGIIVPLRDLLAAVRSRRLDERASPSALPALGGRRDEIGQLAVALRRLLASLDDRIAATEHLAADLAHEIRNPLASLQTAAEAMSWADAGQREELAGIIIDGVARLDRLVGEMSSASRLDADLVREQAVRFDLGAVVRGLAAHLAPRAAERSVELILDLPQEPVPLTGLETRLAQVAANLLDNALSVCDEGDAIRVWLRRRDRQVLLVVEDTGPGLPEGAAERIFRRFYSHRPAGKPGEHSGLGLAISRQIVEAHDGMIWAENIRPTDRDLLSEPLGARFAVVLPL